VKYSPYPYVTTITIYAISLLLFRNMHFNPFHNVLKLTNRELNWGGGQLLIEAFLLRKYKGMEDI